MAVTGRERIVVVGAGVAGLRAAERLRELDFRGELVIVGEEPFPPYHRPALSKELLVGTAEPSDITLLAQRELDAVWRLGTRAAWLETDRRVVHLPGGEELGYDGLVIATGVQPRHLPGAPRHDPRVHVLRTMADAVAVRRSLLANSGPVAVIGGGFIGCEVASSARALGKDTTIITRNSVLFERVLGAEFGAAIGALHQARGVKLAVETAVRHWELRPEGITLHLSNGEQLIAGCVVIGVGSIAVVDWLQDSGLVLQDGVLCEPTCHAVGVSDVVVAGDIARWPNLRFGTTARRIEHWLNAVEMGRAAAENLLSGRQSARPFMPLPQFWTEQHGLRMQAAGVPALATDAVSMSGSVQFGQRVTGYVSRGWLVGLASWDSPGGMLQWTSELESQLPPARRVRRRHARVS